MKRDLRFAVRMLLKQPGFSLIAILTLALGIGVTSAVFSLIQGVLLTPPPYKKPRQLVLVPSARTDGQKEENPRGWQTQALILHGCLPLGFIRQTILQSQGSSHGQPPFLTGSVAGEVQSLAACAALDRRPLIRWRYSRRRFPSWPRSRTGPRRYRGRQLIPRSPRRLRSA
jgi:hypothetical protein